MYASAAAVAACLLTLSTAPLTSAGGDATCTARNGADVRWVRLAPGSERPWLDRWCSAVGPPARSDGLRGQEVFTSPFVVASWNVHVGGGDVDRFVADLRAGRLTQGRPVTQFVLLLQEAYRAGAEVPGAGLLKLLWASAQQPPRLGGTRDDIHELFSRLHLYGVYVPSMRNGAPLATNEDRGNAILSTVPLTDVAAIELPLESQRRVALQAQVRLRSPQGDSPLTIVCTHFTNMVMHHLWLFSESGRYRQAHALSQSLPHDGPLVVGGDFNAWFGFRDAAYKEMIKVASPAPGQDTRATFGPMRLDHLLFRLPAGWTAAVHRPDDRYGSDHYPLVAVIQAHK